MENAELVNTVRGVHGHTEIGDFSSIHKAVKSDPIVLKAFGVFDCVLINPAKALVLSEKSVLSKRTPMLIRFLLPLTSCHSFRITTLFLLFAYSTNGSEISAVMINGSFIMNSYEITFIAQERVNYGINRMEKEYFNGSGF